MKIQVWDVLAVLLLVGTVIAAAIIAMIFIDPQSGLNPFPPPTMPSSLVINYPTATKTSLALPATWTPTPDSAALPTLQATFTPMPTSTGFILPTGTNTPTKTYTPTKTFTITNTPTITLTPTLTRTFTPTPSKTPNVTGTYGALQTQIFRDLTNTSVASTANYIGTSAAATLTARSPLP